MTVCLFLFIPIRYLSILLSVAIAVGLYFFFLGLRVLASKRSLLTMPTSKIHSAARGMVEVSGVAAGPCTTLAPITGEPCFLYRTTAWQQREGKKNEWEKVADETRHLPFFIDDSTGQLLIEALGADLDLYPRFRREYMVSLLDLDDAPPSVGVFLSRHGIALDRDLCIEERLIKAEDALFVTGTFAENPGIQVRPFSPRSNTGTDQRNPIGDTVRNTACNNHGHDSAHNDSSEPVPAPEVIRLDGGAAPSSTREMSQQAKIAAALARAGMATPQAWSVAGLPHQSVVEEAEPPATLSSRSARSDVRLREVRLREARADEARSDEDGAESSAFNLIPPVVLMKGVNDPTFVISFRSQKEIVAALAWKSAGMVCGGTGIMLLGFYVLWVQIVSL
ncbi:MAG: hypothetical protein WCA13_03485 [Terriglobales bacterium]